jgi:hypothetical protein
MSRHIAALCVLALSLPALADGVVAVTPIQGAVDDAKRFQVEGALREAIATFAPVQAAMKTGEHIEAGKALDIACSGSDSDCWRRIRELAGVDRVVIPVMGGDTLELFLVTRAESLDRKEEIDLGVELAVGAARKVVARLLDVRAQLTVISNVNGAMVELDGRLIGQAPFREPVEGLKAGPHKLRVFAEGHLERTKDFELEPGEDAVLQMDLVAVETGKKGQGPMFWTGAGLMVGGGVTLLGGGVFWVLGYAASPRQSELTAPGVDIAAALNDFRASDQNQKVGIGIAATGAALVATGTILLVLAGDSE